MLDRINRTLQRYFIPRFVISLYYYWRDRCYVSTQTRVQFSNRIVFGQGTVVKPYAVIQTQGGRIVFGRECAIGSFNHITNGTRDIVIGDYVRMANNVTIMGGSRNFKRRDLLIVNQGSHHLGINIGDDVLIGSGAVLLPGCRIGTGAVIGAASVVNSDVPEYAIVAGAPAKVIGYRE